jgi:phosphohistidine phosphatase SixA
MIWLLRHADAEDAHGRPDAERSLTEKGRAQARAAGAAR